MKVVEYYSWSNDSEAEPHDRQDDLILSRAVVEPEPYHEHAMLLSNRTSLRMRLT